MDDSSSEGTQNPLVGFLFGNVDEGNKLDAEYLDEVRHCSSSLAPTRPQVEPGAGHGCRMPGSTWQAWRRSRGPSR